MKTKKSHLAKKLFTKPNKKAFTFVEIIVVIVIISILSTIAFVTYGLYTGKSRDSNRISQITGIFNSLQSFRTQGYLPLPENKISLFSNGELVGYQGYVGDNLLNKIGFKEGGKDPLDNKHFVYATDSKLRKIELLAFLENEIKENGEMSYSKFINNANAASNPYSDRIPYPYGDKLGIILDLNNVPIQDNAKLLETGLDINLINEEFKAVYSKNETITGTGILLQVVYGTVKTGIVGQKCKDYVDENAGVLMKPGYYLINGDNGLQAEFCDMTGECVLNGTTYNNGDVIVAYNADNVAWNDTFTCDQKKITRICKNGEFTGDDSYKFLTCIKCDNGYTWNGTICSGNTYLITFDGTGGAGHTPTNKNVTYNTSVGTLPSNPTKAGYTFNGWFTNPTSGSKVLTTTLYTTPGDSSYYAQWGLNGVCGLSNGISVLEEPTTRHCSAGTLDSKMTNVGNFTWNCKGENGGTTDNCSAYRKYTVYFTGMDPTNPTISINVTYNTAIGALPLPTTRPDYTFNGRFTAETGGTQATESTVITGFTTYYPQWTAINYTVGFNGNGGGGHSPANKVVQHGKAVGTLPSNPTRTGYTFNGWFTAITGGTKITTATIITGNSTYYAQWTAINYTVTFNGNTGAGHSPTSKVVSYGSAVGALPSNPTRAGHTFNGWYTSGSVKVTTATVITSNITFSAYWLVNSYNVNFIGNGGAGHSPASKVVTYGSAVGALPSNPTRAGYTFTGWFTATTGGTKLATTTVITSSVAYYAQWAYTYNWGGRVLNYPTRVTAFSVIDEGGTNISKKCNYRRDCTRNDGVIVAAGFCGVTPTMQGDAPCTGLTLHTNNGVSNRNKSCDSVCSSAGKSCVRAETDVKTSNGCSRTNFPFDNSIHRGRRDGTDGTYNSINGCNYIRSGINCHGMQTPSYWQANCRCK